MGGGSSVETWSGYDTQLLKDDKPQTVCVENSEEKGASAIRRHPRAKDKFLYYLSDDDTKEELNTGWACVKTAFKKYATNKLFLYRPFLDPTKDVSRRGLYKADTYASVGRQVYASGNGLASLKLEEKTNVGIFSINREEWMISHMGNWSQAYRTVALYDTLGAQAVRYIIEHAELSVIFVEKDKLPQLFEAINQLTNNQNDSSEATHPTDDNNDDNNATSEGPPTDDNENKNDENSSPPSYGGLKLRYIIQFDYQKKYNNQHETVSDDDVSKAKGFGVELIGFSELMKKGGDSTDDVSPKSEDLAYIMYTSGTTGDPKGVQLTHQVFACTVASAFRGLSSYGEAISANDAHVSYLPLAHSFEASVISCCVSGGAQVAFWAGNIKTIARDWKEIRPSIVFGVPRIFNKTYDKVKAKVKAAGGVKEWMFNKAEAASQSAIRKNKRSGFYDSVVWSSVCAEVGYDRVRILASGAAPLPPYTAEFLRILCPKAAVVQGYGLTETCAISFFTAFGDNNLGHIGIPVDNIEYRLVDAPECDYFVADEPHQRGEIQMRGPTIMTGYYKNPEATKKCLSDDGWFSTGDIGRINPNGTLSIIDRRKNMFKTAMGEYIAAEKCENYYVKSGAVNQIWIYGNSYKSFVVAIVVPDPLWLVPFLVEKGIWKDEKLTPATKPYCDKFLDVCTKNYDAVKKIVVDDIRGVEKQSDLKKFEKIRDIHLECDVDNLLQGFHVANDTLTPTFKMKRPQLLKKYIDVIKKLYTDNGEPPKDDEHWK